MRGLAMAHLNRDCVLITLNRFPGGLSFDDLMQECGCEPGQIPQLEILVANMKRNHDIHAKDGLWFAGAVSRRETGASERPKRRAVSKPRREKKPERETVDVNLVSEMFHIDDLQEKLDFLDELAGHFEATAQDVRRVRFDLARIGSLCAGIKKGNIT